MDAKHRKSANGTSSNSRNRRNPQKPRRHGVYAALFAALGILQLAAAVPLFRDTTEAAMILGITGVLALGAAVYHAVEASQR